MLISENQNFEQNPLAEPASKASAGQTAAGRRERNLRILVSFVGSLCGLGSIGNAALYIGLAQQWQLGVLAVLNGLIGVVSIVTLRVLFPRRAILPGTWGVTLLFGLALATASNFLNGFGGSGAIIFMVYALMLSSSIGDDKQANLAIGTGIFFAAYCALMTVFSPFEQLAIEQYQVLMPAILGVLFMIYLVMLATQFVTATLRIRLVTSFLAIVIIPLAILAAIQSQYMFTVLNREVNQGLELAAQQTALGVDTFLSDTERSVMEISQMEVFSRYMETRKVLNPGSFLEQEMKMALQVLDISELNSSVYLSSYALLDMDGYVVYDTLTDRLAKWFSPEAVRALGIDVEKLLSGTGTYEGDQDYFLVPARSHISYKSPVQVNNSTKGFFYVSAPIQNGKGQTIGVLRARYDGLLLQDLIKRYNGLLGEKSYAILLDENNIRLADAFTPNHLYKSVAPLSATEIKNLKANRRLPELPETMLSTNYEEFDQILRNSDQNPFFKTSYSLVYHDNEHVEIGAVTKMRSMPWKVVYLNTDYNDELVRQEQTRRTVLVTTIIACLVGMIAMTAARLLSSPIIQLTKTAQSISQGNLNAQAPSHEGDEFGMLGSAFNLMTSQLRGLIGQLEDRVRARTQEIEKQNTALSHRATQLQTVSEIARQIVSSQELETLLSTITRLISERFNFYHVGVFLLDETREYAVLRAANSEGGQRMLARNHRLPVGKVGIVGYATGVGEARIATDVGADAVYFNNPDLPDTRSEMALPLKVGDQIIGALDVQSTQSNAFSHEDIELFTTMADQVAIAIYNNQLYMETRRALDEAQQLHRQYLRGEWAEDLARRKVKGYLYNGSGISAQNTENPLWQKVFATGEPVMAVQEDPNGSDVKSVMALPIAIRGETIGVIHVQDQGEDRAWSEDELAVVNSIANQVAVALENARLFETTVRRAEREKKVVEITAKIRSTNDPEEMMRIAVSELQQALRATRTQIYIRQNGDRQTAGNQNDKN